MGLPVINMTSFFNRELFIYSLGDMSLSKPVSLKKAGFFILGLIIWTAPLLLIFGISFNVVYLVLLFSVPIALAMGGDKPVFDGRTIMNATKVTAKYLFSPKCYTDFTVSDTDKNPEYFVQQEVWISRRRELMKLAQLWEARTAAK